MAASSLVVGGTGFLGRAIAEAAIAAGHKVTVLSRGMKPGGPPGIRYIAAGRLGPLDMLRGERFDFIFDTCAFTPNSVSHLLKAVAVPDRYVLISSASVYGDWSKPGLSEDDAVPGASAADLRQADIMEQSGSLDAGSAGDSYGPLKRACEDMAEQLLGPRAISLRSGLLVGAGDYTDRMTWWVRHFDQGGRIPVPLPASRPVQAIDVRDAAAFAVKAAQDGLSGIYNLTSRPFSLREMLTAMEASAAEPVWIEEERFLAAGVLPWEELPLWLPQKGTFRHFFEIGVEKSFAAGLHVRPLEETLAEIRDWDRTRRDRPLSCGLSAGHEAMLLETDG